MRKYIILLLATFSINIYAIDANTSQQAKQTAQTADVALSTILNKALTALSNKNKEQDASKEEIVELIKEELLPFIDTKLSAQESLKTHWDNITGEQQLALESYIIKSLVRDYSGILVGFKDADKIKIQTDPNIRTKGNKAIVKVNFITAEQNQPILIAAKMIQSDIWRVYDIIFSGVSLVKNYSEQFNSYIKRKGFEKFSNKYLTAQ